MGGGRRRASYRYEATSVAGFIQQRAVAYVARGYSRYVTGEIPERKAVESTDRKILEHYGIELSPSARWRRKKVGKAAVQYLRHGHFFVLLASATGRHPFLVEESEVKDIRTHPLKYGGYSVSYRSSTATGRCHASVRIEAREYEALKHYLLNRALTCSVEELFGLFRSLPYEPYAPVRRQLLRLLAAVNERRRRAGLDAVSWGCIRLARRSVSVFSP